MANRCLIWGLACVVGLATSLRSDAAEPAQKGIEFFEKKIRPVLVDHCYKCHSVESKTSKGGLLVDSAEGLKRGGESGAALVPGDPDSSLLMEALRHEGLEMPPDKKLSDEIIADFATWIRQGAADPRKGSVPSKSDAATAGAARDFWAFQPPRATKAPSVKDAKWPRSDLDRYVLAALEGQGLRPVADADRRVLARRLYFDLIGLPPTPEQMDEFLADPSSRAVENLVDRLLESPHFGERWGRHWLDVARYAESNGNADNVIFGHAWRYRDYVIAAWNADKPFDRFITEQLAGDLLPAESSRERDDLLIATGFLALGSKPRAQNNPDFQMDVVAEQIEVVTTGLMALTVACARCHDHKFDPIPTTEYYSMAGIFTSTQTLYGPAGRNNNGKQTTGGAPLHPLTSEAEKNDEHVEGQRQLAALQAERQEKQAEIQRLEATLKDSAKEAARAKKVAQNKASKKAQKKKAKNDAAESTSEAAANAEKAQPSAGATDEAQAADADRAKRESETTQRIADLRAEITKLDEQVQKLADKLAPKQFAMGARDGKVADCTICLRGDSRKRGDAVPRGFVSVVSHSQAPSIDKSHSGRLELAQWIASPENPLTARVIVNRIWRHLMGRGIVPTVDNFGALGEAPSHPELLDHLALTLIDQGWSMKKMIRHIVLSRTYGLSSEHDPAAYEKDPDNKYLWRHSPHRLDAESLRDAMLAVSGQLDPQPPSGSPVAALAGQDLRNAKANINQLAEQRGKQRSVYLPVLRNKMPEVLDLFDVADPSLVVGSRDTTTVPAQSLYLMNSPVVVQQSSHFATRLLEAGDATEDARIDRAFRLALTRAATPQEIARAAGLLSKAREAFATAKGPAAKADTQAWSSLCQALFASAEFRYVE